jgi:RecB family exonuclease
VLPLLLLLRCAARPERIDADAAVALLSSPLGGADPMRLRRLRRGLLALHLAAGGAGDGAGLGSGEPAAGSDELLVAALRAGADGRADPLPTLAARDSRPLRAVAELLGVARAAHLGGASAEEVLWRIWRASGLPGRWAAASAHSGPTGAQADRDLDAVVALFDAAARYTDRLPGGGDIEGFAQYVADQRIPGDSLAPRAPEGEAVAVLTAHAARGREWRLVAVAGVQEGSWPDPRLRGTLLGVERLVDAVDGAGDRAGERLSRVAPLLAEERRLFYVACSRARDTLLVSAVRGEDEQPSRFLDELDPPCAGSGRGASSQPAPVDDGFDAVRPVTKPPRALVLAELVGELRRAVCAPEADGPPGRRERAAAQLARLAAAGVPGAHPDHWYGLAPPSTEGPLHPPDRPVPVSPSAVEKIRDCPLRWLFERHGGEDGAALPSVTGSLVHALVQACAAGASEEEVEAALRWAWSAVDAGAPWYGRRELERVRGMLTAFRVWLIESRGQGLTQVDLERVVELTLPAGDGEPPVLLRGRVDRLERDDQGRPVIVDVKTGRTPVSKDDALVHPQLAVYQLAAALGAFRDALAGPRSTEPGGARLLYLGGGRAGTVIERVQPGLAGEQLAFWRTEVLANAAAVNGAIFEARQNSGCERCGVRTSCPANDEGRGVPGG